MENLDTFLLALFCFVMGATVVGLVVYLRAGSRNAAEAKPPDPDLVAVARLWRSQKTKRLVVELDEKTYATASELSSEQMQRLAGSAVVLQNWLNEGEPAKEMREAAVVPPALPAPPAAVKEQVTVPPITPPAEVKPVPARPIDALSRTLSSNLPAAVPKFRSIAVQINEVLQKRLPGSPFEAVGIALIEMPDQGVVVRVGAEEYTGVEAVPDPAVRAFIKTAVAEWEANTRTGIR
jgi:hypothetical protein